MKLSEKAVDYPRLVVLAAVSFCLFGVVAIYKLPIERTPRVTIPKIIVAIPNFGASPETNEAEITRKIEDEIGQLEYVDYSASQSMYGSSMVSIDFLDKADIKEAKRDVQNIVDQIRHEFPSDAEDPIVDDITLAEWPVVQVVIYGSEDPMGLRKMAEDLQDDLEALPGVAGVDLFGGLEREVHVLIDPQVLNLYGLSYEDIASAIRSRNAEAPTGTIERAGGNDLRVRFEGKYPDVETIAQTPLANRDGKVVLLSDVAEVIDHHKRITTYADYSSCNAVALLVRGRTDINTIEVVDRIKKIVAEKNAQLGAGVSIDTVLDSAWEIRQMIEQLGSSAGFGLMLVMLILTVAMGWRNAALIGVALPFSLVTGAALLLAAKNTIDDTLAVNNMVLFSIIVVIGMVVDGALIVGENIYRHVEGGRTPYDAAKIGIREVGPSVIAADLTTICAFVPMLFVSGTMGDFLGLMPITVAFTLTASMLVDHFLLPVLSRYWMRPPKNMHEANGSSFNGVEIDLSHVDEVAAKSRVRRAYGRMMTYLFRHKWIVFTGAATGLALVVLVFGVGLIGFEFFPESDLGFIFIDFELPLGSSVHRTRETARILEKPLDDLRRRGELRSEPLTVIGNPGANNLQMGQRANSGPEYGRINIELIRAKDRDRSTREIVAYLRETMPLIPDVRVFYEIPSEGPPVGYDIVVRVMGNKDTPLAELAQTATVIEEFLAKIDGAVDVDMDYKLRPETTVTPRPQVASLFGITSSMIVRATQFAINGVEVTEVDFGGTKDIDIRVRNVLHHRNDLVDLKNLPLRSPSGGYVTLEQVADVRRDQGPVQINHRDRVRVINVTAELASGALADDVFAELQASIEQGKEAGTPALNRPDIRFEFAGENEERDQSMEDLKGAFVIGAVLILIILVTQFNSFSQPFMIMMAIPLSLIGVVVGLVVCGYHFSIASMIGIVALAGIVVNDAIVLVDFINKMRRAGLPLRKAIIQGGQLRLRPIFLTSVTTICGLLPLALNVAGGGEFWQPLAVSIMFGLAFATSLTLIVIPTLYYTITRWLDRKEREAETAEVLQAS